MASVKPRGPASLLRGAVTRAARAPERRVLLPASCGPPRRRAFASHCRKAKLDGYASSAGRLAGRELESARVASPVLLLGNYPGRA